MYFDAVTSSDQNLVHFNGTPDETRDWVRKHYLDCEVERRIVWDGKTLRAYSAAEYLDRK